MNAIRRESKSYKITIFFIKDFYITYNFSATIGKNADIDYLLAKRDFRKKEKNLIIAIH